MQSLWDDLVTNGMNLDSGDVPEASGISADGNTIVGRICDNRFHREASSLPCPG